MQDDFEVLDNGKLQPMTIFENEADPLTAVVMLDTSGSMTLALELVKDAAEQFLIRLMPEDKARSARSTTRFKFRRRRRSRTTATR